MHLTSQPLPRRAGSSAALLCLALLGLLAACGGGSAGGSPDAPAELSYATTPVLYRAESPIPPNMPSWTGGDPDTWQCVPPLPDGLSLDAGGVIAGIPTTQSPPQDYTITASNAAGQAMTTVNIEVRMPEEKSLVAKDVVTDADVRHFLDRTHFGFSQSHYDQIQSGGFAAFVDAITTFGDTTLLENDAKNAYLVDQNDPNGEFPSEADLARWWLYMIVNTDNPFQENLAYKLHDHFATSTTVLGGANSHYYIDHVNLWRHGGDGNLRTLLIQMARDNAMLVWLDGISNQDSQPNENFGREFFELFCLGVDVAYTQQDIVEAARAFTGYRQRFDSQTGKNFIEFDPNRHDYTSKTILGQTIPASSPGGGGIDEDDYEEMVDIVLSTDDPVTGTNLTARWIVRSLLTYFCYEDPPQNVVDELADDLRDGGWELKPVFVKLFQSEAFFSAKAREGLVKGPFEHVAGFMRATNLVGDLRGVDNALRLMGNRPTQPPTVDGWPGGTQWLSAQAMVDRGNLLNFLTEQSQNYQANRGINALQLLPAPDADSGQTVDALALRLNVPLSAAERTTCVTYLDTERDSGGNVTADPFDPVGDPGEAENRVRGLLYILAEHPSYHTR